MVDTHCGDCHRNVEDVFRYVVVGYTLCAGCYSERQEIMILAARPKYAREEKAEPEGSA